MNDTDAKKLSEAERLIDIMSFLFHRRKTSYHELMDRYGVKRATISRTKNKLIDIFDVPFVSECGRNGYIKVADGWRPKCYALSFMQQCSLVRIINGEGTSEDIEVLKTILNDFGH